MLSLRVRVCPIHFLLQLPSNHTRDIISSCGLFNNTFPFTICLPVTFLCCLPLTFPPTFPLPVLCTLRIPISFLSALRILLTLAVIIVIAIARTAHSTAPSSGIRPVPIMIILINCLIPIQWFNGQEVAWLVLPAAWWLNLCPEIIATVPRERLPGAFKFPKAGCMRIGAIDLIPEATWVVPPPILHLVVGFVKHLPHI